MNIRQDKKTGYVPGGRLTRLFFRSVGFIDRLFAYRHRKICGEFCRIVLVKLGGIGDGVLMTPVLKPLKERYPESKIDVVCWTASQAVFRNHPVVDAVFSSPLLDVEETRGLMAQVSLGKIREIRRFVKGADLFVFFNRICTVGGFLKYFLLSFWGGKGVKAGLDTDGRGAYLDIKVPDGGFLLKHEVENARDLMGAIGCSIPLDRMVTNIFVGDEDKRYVDRMLSRLSIEDFIVLHIGSSRSGWRVLKRIDTGVWKTLMEKIVSTHRTPILLVGSQDDAEINQEVLQDFPHGGDRQTRILDIANQTTLQQLTELISRASLFIGTDSGVAHLASCTDTPMITVFGFSDFIGYSPWSRKSRVITRHLVCGPCLYRKEYLTCKNKECLEVTAESIYENVALILGDPERRCSSGPLP